MIFFVPLSNPATLDEEVVYDIRRADGESIGKLLATTELVVVLAAALDISDRIYSALHPEDVA